MKNEGTYSYTNTTKIYLIVLWDINNLRKLPRIVDFELGFYWSESTTTAMNIYTHK